MDGDICFFVDWGQGETTSLLFKKYASLWEGLTWLYLDENVTKRDFCNALYEKETEKGNHFLLVGQKVQQSQVQIIRMLSEDEAIQRVSRKIDYYHYRVRPTDDEQANFKMNQDTNGASRDMSSLSCLLECDDSIDDAIDDVIANYEKRIEINLA